MLAVTIGVVGTTIISQIPVAGPLLMLVLLVFGIGAAAIGVADWRRRRREAAAALAAARRPRRRSTGAGRRRLGHHPDRVHGAGRAHGRRAGARPRSTGGAAGRRRHGAGAAGASPAVAAAGLPRLPRASATPGVPCACLHPWSRRPPARAGARPRVLR